MRQTFINSMPVPAFAAAGVCYVMPGSRSCVVSPAAASLLVASRPQAHQAQSMSTMILAGAEGSYLVTETKPGSKLGGFRGVPPRGRPV